jgi:AraC-like DNA-binding protein
MVVPLLNSWLAQTAFAKYYLMAFNLMILAVLIFVVQVLLKALGQSSFFLFVDNDESAGPDVNLEAKDGREKIVRAALQFMQSDKPYLEPELTLVQLAGRLAIKPRALSEAINDILNQNFFDFINRHRIQEAQQLLTNPVDKKITILEVLYQAGFNSKSSFNALFKKYTGQTPTEFRQKQSA